MKTRLLTGLLVGGLMATMLPGVALAAKPAMGPVTITSPMDVNYPAPNTGSFTADGGILCSAGTVLDTFIRFDGFDPAAPEVPRHVYVEKLFTCADGSGTFDVMLNARRDRSGTEQFRWVITGGTDDYVGLTGSGYGTTTIDVVNVYDGRVILPAR